MKRHWHTVAQYIALNALLVGILLLAPQSVSTATGDECLPGPLAQITVDGSRRHRVAAGSLTSYVYEIANPGLDPVSAEVTISSTTPGWTPGLSPADLSFRPTAPGTITINYPTVGPGEAEIFVLLLRPATYLDEGEVGFVQLDATLGDSPAGCAQLEAVVNNQAKIYIVGLDGLSPGYLYLGRDGDTAPAPGDELMPNLRAFVAEAAWFPGARSSLPAATDMNVFGALSGSWPGTSGIPTVEFFFKGWDEDGEPVREPLHAEDLRYGPNGERALSIFDVARDPAHGGDPETFQAFVSGKYQLDNLFLLNGAFIPDVVADGVVVPPYLLEPQSYLLGDPPSDPNAGSDRDGVNILPLPDYRTIAIGSGNAGEHPQFHPRDRWVSLSALRIMAAEDPEVLVVHFGAVDKIQHAAGAANRPSLWSDHGTPHLMWDDIHSLNRNANREPSLDVVYEADVVSGLLLGALESRAVLDRSLVIFYSDHSGITYMNADLPLIEILTELGVATQVRRAGGIGEAATLNLWEGADPDAIADALESYTVEHPLTGQPVNPIAAITQEEMDLGVDSVLGRFGRDGGTARGEMYSTWLIDYPVDDNSKVIWPDIYLLAQGGFEFISPGHVFPALGGHSGMTTMSVLLALRGPTIVPGVYTGVDTALVDIMPTVYQIMDWLPPGNVDGCVLTEILDTP